MKRIKNDPHNHCEYDDHFLEPHELTALAERVAALEKQAGASQEPEEQWPEYVQPTGAHDAYHQGDQVTFRGKRYLCVAPEGVAVVWSPEVYPDYWQEVIL